MTKTVNCILLKKEAIGLSKAPYPGELGDRILSNVSKEAWQLWLKHQTMLINENKLILTDSKARNFLKKELNKFFFEKNI